jgi:cell division protein FtsZ
MGVAEDEELGDAVNVTVVATGFHEGKAVNPFTGTLINVVHDLNGEEPSKSAINKPISEPTVPTPIEPDTIEVKHVLVDEVVEERIVDPVATPVDEELVNLASIESPIEQMSPRLTNLAEDRQQVSMTFEFEIEAPIIENTISEASEKFELYSEVIEEIAELQSEVETEESEITFSMDDFEETEELTQSVNSEDKVIFSLDDEPVSSEVPSPLTDATESVCPSEKIVHTLSFDEEEDAIGFEPTSEIEEEPILAMSISSKPVESIASHEYEESGDSVLVETDVVKDIAAEQVIEELVEPKAEAIDTPIVSEEQSSVTLSSHSDTFQEQIERAQKRKERLHKFNYRFRNNAVIDNVEREPAYKRQGVQLNDSVHSTDEPLSRMSLSTNESGELELKSRNSFLHDNVD